MHAWCSNKEGVQISIIFFINSEDSFHNNIRLHWKGQGSKNKKFSSTLFWVNCGYRKKLAFNNPGIMETLWPELLSPSETPSAFHFHLDQPSCGVSLWSLLRPSPIPEDMCNNVYRGHDYLQKSPQGLDINSQENFETHTERHMASRIENYLIFCLLVYVNLENYSIMSRKVFFG